MSDIGTLNEWLREHGEIPEYVFWAEMPAQLVPGIRIKCCEIEKDFAKTHASFPDKRLERQIPDLHEELTMDDGKRFSLGYWIIHTFDDEGVLSRISFDRRIIGGGQLS